MPLYNGDLEAKEGPPERARAFKALLSEYQGVFIASPEYTTSITPLIQSRAVQLPPAVVILSQLMLGAVFGILGLALATPLAAAATVPLRHMFCKGEEASKRGRT
jgi:predicted PurR-regulated permease PerM